MAGGGNTNTCQIRNDLAHDATNITYAQQPSSMEVHRYCSTVKPRISGAELLEFAKVSCFLSSPYLTTRQTPK